MKSDSCKKDEPIVIKEEITNNVQKESYLKETSISMYELNPRERIPRCDSTELVEVLLRG